MTEPNAGPAAGRENAQVTYDRRRARSCADTLATIPPNRWDSTTRSIIITLATMLMPSAIDPLLEAGALAVHVDIDNYERARLALDHAVEVAQPAWSPRWHELPDGTGDIREAFAAELDRMGLTAEVDTTPLRADQCRRQHLHGTAELAAACDALEGPFTAVASLEELDDERERDEQAADDDAAAEAPSVHDNGDYRA